MSLCDMKIGICSFRLFCEKACSLGDGVVTYGLITVLSKVVQV